MTAARAGALPPAAEGQAVPRLPPRGPGHRLGRPTTWRLARPDGRAPRSGQGAFGIRMGPPVVTRRWDAATVKAGRRRRAVRAARRRAAHRSGTPAARGVVSQLAELGWRPQATEGGFAAGQPQYNFQVPLATPRQPRTEDDVLAGHEPAVAPQHQEGRQGRRRGHAAATPRRPGARSTTLYVAHRRARPLHAAAAGYFQTMFDALRRRGRPTGSGSTSPDHEGDLVAATIWSGSAATPGTPTAPPPPRSATSAAPTRSSGR